MHWRGKWQPTPVFLPGESQGREPSGLPSMGSHRVEHDRSDLAAAAAINTECIVCNCSSPDASSKQYHSISFDENQSLIFISISVFFATPWTVAHWASLSMGFSRHRYWSGLPCPPLGVLPDPEIKPKPHASPALAGGVFTTSATTRGVYSSVLTCD